jgi:hypothetical protein
MITALTIERTDPLAGGHSFGPVGSYVRMVGVARGEIDPESPHNRSIADIHLAPRNANGRVEYETDVYILRPADPSLGNGRMLYEANNRGNKFLFGRIADAVDDVNDPENLADLGNALPLRLGFTLAWSGWDANVPRRDGQLSMRVPVAIQEGRPLSGVIRDQLVSGTRRGEAALFRLAYKAVPEAMGEARLWLRRHARDQRQLVAPDKWRFVDPGTIALLPEGAKPQIGSLYDLIYRATDAQIMGLGFAATRDLISYLWRRPEGAATLGRQISHRLAIGFSQGGRYLRDFIAQGFNQDEDGHRVFDGVLAHTAGAGGVFLNQRFAQPFRTCTRHEDHEFPENAFPFSTAPATDPLTDKTDALFRGSGSDPLFMQTNTSTEYWQKGASLLHTCPRGLQDLELPANARVYLLAGTQHGGRIVPSDHALRCANPINPHNPMPILRALLVALDAWVTAGQLPPSSRVPSLARGTLVPPEALDFPAIAGVAPPPGMNEIAPVEDWTVPKLGPAVYRPLVCQADQDGNERDGVRTPDLLAPLGTYTGWNVYRAPYPEDELADREGSFIPFAASKDERARRSDPRRSLAERYGTGSGYVAAVERAARALVQERLLLPQDAERYVAAAKAEARFVPSSQPI